MAVSYTHLDVYKRQDTSFLNGIKLYIKVTVLLLDSIKYSQSPSLELASNSSFVFALYILV